MLRTNLSNPVFIEKTTNGERIYDIPSRLLKDRIIRLDSEIDLEVASQITSLLFILDREDKDKKISFWINSNGGSAPGFFAIYDMMHRIQAPVQTIGMGEVASAAAFLLACGTPGLRYAMPNLRVMIHQIQIDNLEGSNAEVEITTKEIREIQENLTTIMAKHTGHTKSKIKRDTKMDKWMSAVAAKEYGIVDSILAPNKQIPELLKRENKGKNASE